jgi:hypothetical protein
MTTRLTHNETLLLTAALQQGPSALSAWETWRESCPLDERIDVSSHRMIPLLHHNLRAQGVEHTLMRRYAAVRRFYWFRNRVLFDHTEKILSLLQREDIPTLALKGLSLALKTYPSMDLRPMSDIDLLVSKADGMRALELLMNAGLKPKSRWVATFLTRSTDPFRSRCEFALAGGGMRLDLHVRLLTPIPSLALAQRMMKEGAPLQVGSAWTLSAQPTEQIFHLILHSTTRGSRLRGASDIAALIRARGTDIDWYRLSALGEQYSCLALVKESIEDVFAAMGVEPPDNARAALRRRRISLSDRLEWKLRRNDYINFRFPFWFDYRRLRRAERELGTPPMSLISVLADRWWLHRKRDVPLKALEKILYGPSGRPKSRGPKRPQGN